MDTPTDHITDSREAYAYVLGASDEGFCRFLRDTENMNLSPNTLAFEEYRATDEGREQWDEYINSLYTQDHEYRMLYAS